MDHLIRRSTRTPLNKKGARAALRFAALLAGNEGIRCGLRGPDNFGPASVEPRLVGDAAGFGRCILFG